MNLPTDYDAKRLAAPDDARAVGDEEGATCNRLPEPDEDAPRGYRPKPCHGVMGYEPVEHCSCHIAPPCERCVSNPLVCDTCGEEA